MDNVSLNITTIEPKWETCSEDLKGLSEQVLQTTLEFVTKLEEIDFLKLNKPISIGLCLSNNDEIRALNKEFRNIDKATNVLSFASIDDENFYNDIEIFDDIDMGDIIIAYETLEAEAKSKNISLINHYTHLLIHGILHLLGFDHIDDEEAEYMEELEINILNKFNIDNPYTE